MPDYLARGTNPGRMYYIKRDITMTQQALEVEIGCTPTSEKRNRMTQANIFLMLALEEIKHLSNDSA